MRKTKPSGALELRKLEERVAALEQQLGGVWPSDVCRACGKRGLRLHSANCFDAKGIVAEVWKCAVCSQEDVRTTLPR